MTSLPVYLVADASSSLASDIHTVNEAIGSLFYSLSAEPSLADAVRVAVIQFASEAEEILPLSDIREITSIPAIKASGSTDYGAAFRLLRQIIPRDIAAMRIQGLQVFRPVMLFITDGSPTDPDWRDALQELQSPEFRERPTIIAFGIGSVDPSVLREVGSANGGAFVVSSRLSTSGAIRSIFDGLSTMLSSTLQSSVSPGAPAASIALSDDWLNLSSIPEGL